MKILHRLAPFLILVTLAARAIAAGPEGWSRLRVPGYWEKAGGGTLDAHDGFAWYRFWVVIPEEWKGMDLLLELGKVDDCDETYLNGRELGRSGGIDPFRSASGTSRAYPIPADRIQFGGANLVAVRVWDGGGAGGIASGPLQISCAKGALSLRGTWEFRTGDDPAWAQWPGGSDPASRLALAHAFAAAAGPNFAVPIDRTPLAGTDPLTLEGDLASRLVEGVDRFLLRKIDESVALRERHWKRDFSSPEAYGRSLETNRVQLAHILGVRDVRTPRPEMQWVAAVGRPSLVGRGPGYEIQKVRWPSIDGVTGEGLMLTPVGRVPVADVVAIPDAGQTPEQVCGLQDGVAPESQYARRLAENGCRVLVPAIMDRSFGPHLGKARMTAREFLYRSAFEMGRHLIGYEIQKVLGGVDWFVADASPGPARPIGVFGWGEGGLLALDSGALDPRIRAVAVSGYFDDRNHVWEEPLDRNVFGLLDQFGDAELAAMIAPRALVIEAARGPEVTISGQGGGGPGRLLTPGRPVVEREVQRARNLTQRLSPPPVLDLVISGDGSGPFGSDPALASFLKGLGVTVPLVASGPAPERIAVPADAEERRRRQLDETDRHTQRLLVESPEVRREFMKRLDTRSMEAYAASSEAYREYFANEVVGRFSDAPLPPHPRTRRVYEEEKWVGYEVVLDVFPEVMAYGILLVPRDLKPGERRPVVVCQHGLEGRPQDVVSGDQEAYHDFAARLADRGFITFAPQNLYIFTDRFRTLQRKSNALKKTLFSTIVPQHQQIVDWLQTLPFVDPQRVAFYGLSYGGKSAMRIPPLVKDYVLSICSADFNEWVGKNAATSGTLGRYSYVWGGEYEIFEWDLGSTFNYAEMAALIAPRPFMVERGHFDGVAPDESVAWEFAKVKFLYDARLGLGDRCEMETFVGPHTIHGKGTFDFLHRHLNWPKP